MTFYQELQLNQAGSKALIRSCTDKKEKMRHTAIYLLKIFITMVFCMAVVIGFSKIFGNDNSIVGVVVLLCVMAFRFADFGIRTPHAMGALAIMFAILTPSGKCRRSWTGIRCKYHLYFNSDGFGMP